MGRCKLECPDSETECCICCSKHDSCPFKCNTIDDYEYSEECDEYVEEGGVELEKFFLRQRQIIMVNGLRDIT